MTVVSLVMDVTVLGSGEAVGVPAPLCSCKYCTESERRRRPGLLVETDAATVVLDVGPDIKEQLDATDTSAVDAFFVTHHHFDHVGGLHDLAHAAMGFDAHVGIDGGHLDPGTFDPAEKPADPEFAVYLTETALGHVEASNPHLLDVLDLRTVVHGEAVTVGDLTVAPVPVHHADSTCDTVGYAVTGSDEKVVYAPDMRKFASGGEYPDGAGDRPYAGSDLLFVEGAALFRAYGHGEEADLRAAIAAAAADRTILLNCNEHLQRMTTAELRAAAAADGFEIGADFAEYRL